ncbi:MULTISPECIES: helix-turn-helix domain-containing protein [unclassified Streptomyces]|uniref:helix-turn-helix domain-containing protein n=1 Tax=unclassified Streptomyces TaxID=2593676 RepID=UPI003812EA12
MTTRTLRSVRDVTGTAGRSGATSRAVPGPVPGTAAGSAGTAPGGGPAQAVLVDDCFVTAGGHPPHVHTFHQFLYPALGRITVSALGREHELSASVALWIPAGIEHGARFSPDALIVVENFDAERFALHTGRPTPVNVTEQQRLLLLGRTRTSGAEHDDPEVFAALSAAHPDSLPLPQPITPAALAVARALTKSPDDARTATEWAAELYTSSTSLRRAFRAETGMAFSEWRTRLRLNQSLPLLDQGQLVSVVASRVGFVSANGYILAFRRHFGRTPGAYVRESQERYA